MADLRSFILGLMAMASFQGSHQCKECNLGARSNLVFHREHALATSEKSSDAAHHKIEPRFDRRLDFMGFRPNTAYGNLHVDSAVIITTRRGIVAMQNWF